MRYIPNSPEERAEMLKQIGLNSAEELFHSIPEELRLRRQLDTPAALSEIELLAGFEQMAARNTAARRSSFLGAGVYSHYIPTVVDRNHLAFRVLYCLHALPAGDIAGHAAGDLRIPNARLPVDGNGSGQRLHV